MQCILADRRHYTRGLVESPYTRPVVSQATPSMLMQGGNRMCRQYLLPSFCRGDVLPNARSGGPCPDISPSMYLTLLEVESDWCQVFGLSVDKVSAITRRWLWT